MEDLKELLFMMKLDNLEYLLVWSRNVHVQKRHATMSLSQICLWMRFWFGDVIFIYVAFVIVMKGASSVIVNIDNYILFILSYCDVVSNILLVSIYILKCWSYLMPFCESFEVDWKYYNMNWCSAVFCFRNQWKYWEYAHITSKDINVIKLEMKSFFTGMKNAWRIDSVMCKELSIRE